MRLSTLFWLVLIAAVAVGWWKERVEHRQRVERLKARIETLEAMPPPQIYYSF